MQPATIGHPPPPQRSAARRFTLRLLGTALAVLAGCGFFNAVVDPYGLFRWVDRPGFNAVKPRATQAGIAFKYRAIDFNLPQTLLLGNSRVEMGWNPDDLPAQAFGRVVNAALPGQDLQAMVGLADHAWARSRPHTVVIGAEFFDCLEAGAARKPAVTPASPWAGGSVLQRTRAGLTEALSLDTTVDSVWTLLSQRNPDAADLRRNGFQPAREYPLMQKTDGPRKLFVQRDQENARARMTGPKTIRYGDGSLSECFAALDQLLGDAQARRQTVFVATYPYHARLLQLILDAGLWPAYEEWKSSLVDLVAKHRRAGLAVQLRDFGAYHRYAVEPIPGAGQTGPVPQWYWESGHFRAELGARMLGVLVGAQPAEPLFGVELNAGGLAAHLAEVRASRQAFAASQPHVVEEIAGIAGRACGRAGPGEAGARC